MTPAGERPFSFFVKVVRSWVRSPTFAFVPPEHREAALARLPWQVEPLVYRSDLGSLLPDGLTMPRAYAVVDLDDESAALWLAEVDVCRDRWTGQRFAEVALLLGRLAASARVRPLAALGRRDGQDVVRGYAGGRLLHQVLPALHTDELWAHPLVAGAFDDRLRSDLLSASERLWDVVGELDALPVGTAHGDACTRNLLVQPGLRDIVLIDYAFWGKAPLGFDLGQLLLGEVQMGERPAAELPSLSAVCLPAYVEGLRREGCDAPAAAVARAHALQMLLFSGLSAVPFEHLRTPPTPELHRIAAGRARSARFVLDLVSATG